MHGWSRCDDARALLLEYLKTVIMISMVVGDDDIGDRLFSDKTYRLYQLFGKRGRAEGINQNHRVISNNNASV